MIEKIVLDYLSTHLDVPVFMEIPEEIPKKFVVISKLGSSQDNCLKFASFAVQSYADSLYDAAALNDKVKTEMDNMTALDVITSSKLDSDYVYDDTSMKLHRYQAVYDIYHY